MVDETTVKARKLRRERRWVNNKPMMTAEEREELRDGKKQEFLESLARHKGLVYFTCDEIGVPHQTYQNWMIVDPEFKTKVEFIHEKKLDNVEHCLDRAVNKLNVPAIMFYLKTKGKHRGYVEDKTAKSADTEEYTMTQTDEEIVEAFKNKIKNEMTHERNKN